jgi:hypothetical protein
MRMPPPKARPRPAPAARFAPTKESRLLTCCPFKTSLPRLLSGADRPKAVGRTAGGWWLQIINPSARTMETCSLIPAPAGRQTPKKMGYPPWCTFPFSSLSEVINGRMYFIFCYLQTGKHVRFLTERALSHFLNQMESTRSFQPARQNTRNLPKFGPFSQENRPYSRRFGLENRRPYIPSPIPVDLEGRRESH